MGLMFEPFRRYADFSGRSRRSEFWLFILFQWAVYIGLILFGVAAGVSFASMFDGTGAAPNSAAANGVGIGFAVLIGIFILFWLGTLIPNLAVAARRMQDQDIPGWIGILLVIGGILFSFPYLIMAVFGFIPGTRGPNQYGPDPKADGTADIFG
jgi:uncharacterized membrane protein YhaH (DUF805 family)